MRQRGVDVGQVGAPASQADHRAIDDVLTSRVAAEDDELTRLSGPTQLLGWLLRPFN